MPDYRRRLRLVPDDGLRLRGDWLRTHDPARDGAEAGDLGRVGEGDEIIFGPDGSLNVLFQDLTDKWRRMCAYVLHGVDSITMFQLVNTSVNSLFPHQEDKECLYKLDRILLNLFIPGCSTWSRLRPRLSRQSNSSSGKFYKVCYWTLQVDIWILYLALSSLTMINC